jgi:DNA mismatch repair protein MutS
MGYYVAASKFILSPYHALFTRISSNDNIFKGLSSFMIEMVELATILKRNNNKTLVLGDEICKGTDTKSSLVIVSYMLKLLSNNNVSFLTATHLHELVDLKPVKELTNISIKHLKIIYDEFNDKLIYDRELLDGTGKNFYGIQIAKYLMKNRQFNIDIDEILNECNNENNIESSKYNADSYLEKCEICASKNKLETHHIIFQKDFNKNKINTNKKLLHVKKDAVYNLVTVCSDCHDKIDSHKIIVMGWKETSDSKMLDYYYKNDDVKKIRYEQNIIDFIKAFKGNDIKMLRIQIKETFNKRMMESTIRNIQTS